MIKLCIKKNMSTSQGRRQLGLDLEIPKGGFVSFFGASGTGKTTILRILAGLTEPQEGRIEVEGNVWFDSRRGINLSTQQRGVGFVFQEDTLFPHMTVGENLAYACRDREALEQMEDWIKRVELKGLRRHRPQQLSGGQKQKVALVRALLSRPKILLLDEPFSNLDVPSRLNLQDQVAETFRQTKITTILVSHDLPEVSKLSQKVFILENGHISRSGTPQEVFSFS